MNDIRQPRVLSPGQIQWLKNHGGRDGRHVEEVGDDLYVWFGHWEKGGELVPLPKI